MSERGSDHKRYCVCHGKADSEDPNIARFSGGSTEAAELQPEAEGETTVAGVFDVMLRRLDLVDRV